MKIDIHISNPTGTLDRFEGRIRGAITEVLAEIEGKIALPDVRIEIDDDAKSAIPETGVGGYAPSANLLKIHIDPDFEGLEENIDAEIKSTLAHELHHCARWAAIGYGNRLLEALVSEGLADHFDIEINGGTPKPWSTALTASELETVGKMAEREFSNKEYSHSLWFFGADTIRIPRWAGYSLGFVLVGKYLEETGKRASELVSESADSFILKQ